MAGHLCGRSLVAGELFVGWPLLQGSFVVGEFCGRGVMMWGSVVA